MKIEFFFFISSLIILGVSSAFSAWHFTISRILPKITARRWLEAFIKRQALAAKAMVLAAAVLSLIFITASIISRAIITGHGPFSSMYEFTLAFSWGIIAMTLFFWWKYHSIAVIAAGEVIALGLLVYAYTLPSKIIPLVPALQNSLLLSVHVASAVIAYGTFTIGFVSAIFFMLQTGERFSWLPKSKYLEKISYHSVMIGFPFLTLVIVLGALWADIAWGKYWNWDPKETASLVTWLIYAGYLHARIIRGWRGRKAALLIIIGFAAVIFTFLGNYIFNGLHSYG